METEHFYFYLKSSLEKTEMERKLASLNLAARRDKGFGNLLTH